MKFCFLILTTFFINSLFEVYAQSDFTDTILKFKNICRNRILKKDTVLFSIEKFNPNIHSVVPVRSNEKYFDIFINSETPDSFSIFLNDNFLFIDTIGRFIHIGISQKDVSKNIYVDYPVKKIISNNTSIDSLNFKIVSHKYGNYIELNVISSLRKLYLIRNYSGKWEGEFLKYDYIIDQ